jgi:hypothetical protein
MGCGILRSEVNGVERDGGDILYWTVTEEMVVRFDVD